MSNTAPPSATYSFHASSPSPSSSFPSSSSESTQRHCPPSLFSSARTYQYHPPTGRVFATPTLAPGPTPDSGLRVEPRGVYVLLWLTDQPNMYHWGVLVAQTARTGVVFHQARMPPTTMAATTHSSSTASSTSEPGEVETGPGGEGGGGGEEVGDENEWTWRLVMQIEDVGSSPGLLCALQVGTVDDVTDEWMDAVKECVRSTTIPASAVSSASSPTDQRPDSPDNKSRNSGVKEKEALGFSCRAWALAAVFELADGGFIGMTPDRARLGVIELEAKMLAKDTQMVGMRMVRQSVMI